MVDLEAVEILLVEDNPADAELTLRALKKRNWAIGCSGSRTAPRP